MRSACYFLFSCNVVASDSAVEWIEQTRGIARASLVKEIIVKVHPICPRSSARLSGMAKGEKEDSQEQCECGNVRGCRARKGSLCCLVLFVVCFLLLSPTWNYWRWMDDLFGYSDER